MNIPIWAQLIGGTGCIFLGLGLFGIFNSLSSLHPSLSHPELAQYLLAAGIACLVVEASVVIPQALKNRQSKS